MGTLLRMESDHADVVLVMCEPTTKSIEVARRAADIAASRAAVMVVANRIADDSDVESVRDAMTDRDIVVVPEDGAIAMADRQGRAPIDSDGDAPGVLAIVELARRIESMPLRK